MRCETGLANHLGSRPSNQDRCAIAHRNDSTLLLLADGMGGHARGDLAAQGFVNTLSDAFYQAALPIVRPAEFLHQAIGKAHRAILELGLQQQPPVSPRTTAVACLIQQSKAWWVHVGDSRLYLIRNREVAMRTRDHTYVEDLYARGAITEAQMANHPMRNYVTYCLGGSPEPPSATLSEAIPLQPGDVIMLCSDGLWSALEERQIVRMLDSGEPIETTSGRLAEAAERASYPNSDNISVAALRLLADLEVDTGTGDERRQAAPPVADPPAAPDTLSDAIDHIRDAIRRYHDELDKD